LSGGIRRLCVLPILLLLSLATTPATAQTQHWFLDFPPSADHNLVVNGSTVVLTSYSYQFLPAVGPALPAQSLGKPPFAAVITVDVEAYVAALPAGLYRVVVLATGPSGTSTSVPSVETAVGPVPQPVPIPGAPGAPVLQRRVVAPPAAGPIELAWDANPVDDNVTSYQVGYRTAATGSEMVTDVGNVTGWVLPDPQTGTTYWFRVFAQNADGVRSAPSNKVTASRE